MPRFIGANAQAGVTWIHLYVTPDKKKTFCVYEGPNQDAIRRAAAQTGVPVNRITEVRGFDPYFTCRSGAHEPDR